MATHKFQLVGLTDPQQLAFILASMQNTYLQPQHGLNLGVNKEGVNTVDYFSE